ncbi:hypothetical protein [Methyloraptor flagellatus]|uniref:Uncharacterized protein n=1 Tax=Methyloraptor flagellatus TaxID=3162530 RepID=A0AAU7XE52_9HYPH
MGLLASDIQQVKQIVEYVEFFKSRIEPWLTPGGRNPELSNKDINSFHDALKAIVKDTSGGNLDLKARLIHKTGKEEIRSEFSVTSDQARIIDVNITKEKIERRISDQEIHKQVFMTLHQASLDEARAGKSAGEKGIIATISDRPLRLVYASDLAGQLIKSELRGTTNPLKKAFLIDVNVEYINGTPHAYRVLNVHSIEEIE